MSVATEKKVFNCIMCPLGCELTAEIEDGVVLTVKGNQCPRGAKYARDEITAPVRMLTSTVRVRGGALPLLPVVSKEPLPKGRILDGAAALRQITATAPVHVGDVIASDFLGLGVDIVASRDMPLA